MIAKFLRPLAAAFAFICCAGLASPSSRITYTLTPVMNDGALQAMQVDLVFRGQADGETTISLPDEWGGEEELWRGIEDLAVLAGASMRDGDVASERVLSHRPNARIHIRYRLIQDWDGVPTGGRNTYRPIIQPTYFHLIGHAAFARPDLHNATPVRVRRRAMPRGWAFASDLQHRGLSLGHVSASITVGGDYRVLRGSDRNIRVAIRGAWDFSDEAFTEQIGEIISGHRAFWGDRSSPYLVSVTQTVQAHSGQMSLGGTGLDDAFAFFATPNVDDNPITRVLAHESLHSWIPGRIGGIPDDNEAADYWFSEGFTDFYTGRLLVREGLWTSEEFAADLNEMLAAYAQSTAREAPNTRILADFWRDADVQQLPYQRGRLLATLWDARLRAQGRSLDEAILEMHARASAGESLPAATMLSAVLDSMGLDVRADIAVHVEAGEAILLPGDVFAPCGRVVTREVGVFHRGFDIDRTEANHGLITGVDPALPAYAAGMRDGMELIRRQSGLIGDAEQEITYVVRDDGQERAITYLPRGHGVISLQRLEIDEPPESNVECRAVLAGA